jgi:hypothetical protein
MPLGTVLGEAISKITSVRIIDVGSGQQRTEIDAIGEIKGEVPGQGFSTAVFVRECPAIRRHGRVRAEY